MSYPAKRVADASPKVTGFLGFDGVTTLDLTGPLETFATARLDPETNRQRCYRAVIIGVSRKTFKSRSGVTFKTQHTLETAPALDSVVIPGGVGLRNGETMNAIAAWLQQRAPATRRIASVCAGIYPVARTGFLDGRSVTTHWRYAGDVARAFPRLRMNSAASFVSDGAHYTCGGGTAAIEMSLAMIEEDYGSRTALAVARELVVSLRPAGKEQSLDLSAHEADVHDRLAELPGWITSRLSENLSVQVLAERACVCPRHFSRLFKKTFRTTPASFVEQLRIGEAERRLATRRTSIESIAASVGFKSAEVFRRAFERRVGQTPGRFQRESQRNANAWTAETGTRAVTHDDADRPSLLRR
jgi:transcriptional regulator GlxA family with amidase domain